MNGLSKPKIPSTLQAQAWKRAEEKSKPKTGYPWDWEDYEKMSTNEIDTGKYHKSKYKLSEHEYKGWYWEHETQQFMRWNDMQDYYRNKNES